MHTGIRCENLLLIFGRPFVKRFALCYRTIVCPLWLSVCDIWMDQDETRYGGRCYVRWGPSSTQRGTASLPQFSAHVLCGQMAGWINMPLGMQVGLGPGDNGPSSPTWANPKRAQQCPLFSAGVCYGQGHPSQLLLSSCFLIHD